MRKGLLMAVLCVLCFGSVMAQQAGKWFDVKLWPQGPVVTNGRENLPEDGRKGIFTPEMRVFLPDSSTATGRAVLVCPGGGYTHLAMEHEGYDWAPFFNSRGIACIVLKYRMPFGNRNVPFSDAQEALRLIYEHASEWHLNPYDIGIMGSSAGGHLASTMAVSAPYGIRPAFQILFYPVISMERGKTHRGSLEALLGKDASDDLQRRFSNERNVRRHIVPPAILLLSNDDTAVPPANSTDYYESLQKSGIYAEMHVYPTGGHGWGFRTSFAHHDRMLADLSAWLESLKAPAPDVVRVACVGNSITDGHGIPFSDERGYPARLGKILGGKYLVRNFGVSGHTMLQKGDCPYMANQAYQACKDFNPDIVVIKLGTNDSKPYNWAHKDEFAGDMQKMIDELKALPSHPRICLAYPAKALKPSFDISDSVIVNEVKPLIDKIAKKNRLQVIDLYSVFEGRPDLMQSDGIHPNEAGAQAMAETVARALQKKD